MAFLSCDLVFFILYRLLILVLQAKGGSSESSTCPKSFSCGKYLTDLSFPFSFNSTQQYSNECGLMALSGCDAKPFPRIQLLPGGDWYYALGMPYNYTIVLRDLKLQTTLGKHKCRAFDKNISLPDSPSISFKILTLFNFFKCYSANPNITHQGRIPGYGMYNFKGFNIYYKLQVYDDGDIQAHNLPSNCSLVQLPSHPISDDGDVFKMLSPVYYVEWKLSDECNKCHYSGGQCQTGEKTNKFYCYRGTSKRGHDSKTWFLLATGIIFCSAGLLILLFCFRENILWYKYLRFWESNAEDHKHIEMFLKNNGSYAPKRYNYLEVQRITNGFKNRLGQGGYGYVYKGHLRSGCQVAVKVLNGVKGNGEEFINEVASISRTSHVNIVSLVGFCFEGRKRALIYEFMPNGSLEKFIYKERTDIRQLGWPMLYKIALGIARGLEYLHRGCNTRIVHFDIKPHNILLDEDFCPKISDFGLAKLCMKKESIVMLGARGTIGYIAPEIVCRNLGGVSHKSDIYSYRMMVLEMVGGRRNVDVGVDRTSEIYFPHWLYQRLEVDEELKLIGITNKAEKECALKMVMVSLWCIQTDPSNRPSISRVVEMLEGKLEPLQIPPKPYLFSPSRSEVD